MPENKEEWPAPPAHRREPARAPRRFRARYAWWIHSAWALCFGVGVMLFARRGLNYADTALIVLGAAWLIVFVAFRFVVGAKNRGAVESKQKKGLRIVTNYVIKQLYQQMFFFLVPLYASSATWSWGSWNWWLVPVLLLCAVVSTLDLVFDNIIMERRVLAASMYGLCVFGVLQLLLPLTTDLKHFTSLLLAAAATAPTVALLSYPVRRVLSVRGLLLTGAATALVCGAAYHLRGSIPPAPTSVVAMAVGHGVPGEFECVPGQKSVLRADRLEALRCVTEVSAPGGLRDEVVHIWSHRGNVVARFSPHRMDVRECAGHTFRSELKEHPLDPAGPWSCRAETGDGQLLGQFRFTVSSPP